MKTMRRSSLASSNSVLRNVFLIGYARRPRSLRRRQFGERLRHQLSARRAVVPHELIFHEADALALDGMRHDAARLPGHQWQLGEGALDLIEIVTVDLAYAPAEGLPLGRQRLEVDDVLDAAETLNLVVVDDRD